ncbi:immunoglobulin-like domain-containing protein [Clostridium neuense]|uniref:Immunoglobulin-like domain-containing protein n=1 Tax=Clostridium neuense TaxID=1728934 RepID=A0ABW8TGA1_9CLOT
MSKKLKQVLSWAISFFMIFFLVFNGWPKNVKADANSKYIAIAAGYYHMVALDSDGHVWSWGDNSCGELGTGDTKDRNVPTQISTLDNIVEVSGGGYDTEAIDKNGHVWSWGQNDCGQLGTGDNIGRNIPTEISISTNIVSISAGSEHTEAIDENGNVWSWGQNFYSQLGTGDNADRNTPTEILIQANIVSISARIWDTEALDSNGHVWSWGMNQYGQLGTGDNTDRNKPTEISIPAQISSITTGDLHSLALDTSGGIWSFGDNSSGQLGTGDNMVRNKPTQILIPGLNSSKIKAISTGSDFTAVLDDEGNIWSFGNNSDGQLGTGDNANSSIPVNVNDSDNGSLDKASLEIGYASGDNSSNVTQNITLPAKGANGTNISWASSNEAVISNTGVVTRPPIGSINETVSLIATITKGSYASTKDFTVTVLEKPISITSVSFPQDGTYKSGDNLDFVVNFNGNVKVNSSSGTPYLPINISNKPVEAHYISGSGISSLIFRYTIVKGDDSSGISVGSSLNLNGGNINSADSAGVPCDITFSGRALPNIIIDTTPPTFDSSNGAALDSDSKKLTLAFSENIANACANLNTLRGNITFSSDGINFNALSPSDTVAIENGKLIIIFDKPLIGQNNEVKIAANSIKDAEGNIKTDETDINSIQGIPRLIIDIANPTAGTVNSPYNFNFLSLGGSGSKAYSLETGSLPSGLKLAEDGTLSGTPTSSGTFNFKVKVTDASGQSIDYEYAMLVNNSTPPIPPTQTGVTLNLKFTGQNSQSSTVNVPNFNFTSSIASNGLKQYEFDLPENKVMEIEGAGLQTNSSSVQIMDGNNNSIGEVQFPSSVILQISILNNGNTMFPVTISGNNNFPTKTYMANLNITTLGSNKHFNVSFTEVSAPSVPTNVKAVAGNGCATVSFAPSASNGGCVAVNYVVTSNPGGITGTSTGDPVTITGLTNGTQYTFTVKAVNMIGESAESLPSNSVTPSEGLVISNINPSNGTVATSYSFNFSSSGGFDPKVYSLESGNLPNGLTLGPNGTLSGTPTSAGTFNFKVKVTDNLGQTSDSSFVMVVKASVPSAPTNVTASAGDGCALVSFALPRNNGGSPITSYKIISNTGMVVGTGTGSPITVTGLTNGVTYNFKVVATNAQGDSVPSAASNNVTPSAPYTPPYIPPVPQPVTETRTVPVTAKVGNNEFTLGNVTVVRTINTNGTIKDEVMLDESSVSQIIANALKNNAASVDIILNDSVSITADSIEFQADGNCTKLLQENKLSLNVEAARGSISLPYATLMQLTGTIIQGTFSEISDSRTPTIISEYAAGAKQIGDSLKLDTNFSGAAEVTIPITADELQKGSGDANFLSNLAAMVQHSDGENEVVTGTIVYDSNNKAVGIKLHVKKFSIFTLIELPNSTSDGNAKVIPYKVNSDKAWTVNFSNDIDKTTVNKDSVYVVDDEGNKVDIKLECIDKALIISPVENYKSGHKYHLYITDKVQSVNKKTLKEVLEYEFNVI